MNKLDPREDGITHINTYSRGSTELGQELSNFAHTPFVHPRFGPFESMEGYWYWLSTGCQHDGLRTMWGFMAKQEGKRLTQVPCDNFEELICEGIEHKVRQNPSLARRLAHSTLPLCHYYWYGRAETGKYATRVPESSLFQMLFLEELRTNLGFN